jgi:predicted regulator of Ras-like GTPase activity (Roadblock/LC7/MglB family)
MIASVLPADIDETSVGGMTATLHSLGTRAAIELQRGLVQEVLVRGENGYAVMMTATKGTMLLILANKKAKQGMIYFDMKKAIEEIQKVL